MDQNKLTKLKEIGYRILSSCSLCQHGDFQSDDWGTCKIQTYSHAKHSDKVRQLSIHKSGGCPQFEPDEIKLTGLYGFRQLL